MTKKFFELYIIPNPQNFISYKGLFDSDISVTLKEENNISYCYSSRLIHDFKRKISDNTPIEYLIINKDAINANEVIINNFLLSLKWIHFINQLFSNYIKFLKYTYVNLF